jgi:hypothetical protein
MAARGGPRQGRDTQRAARQYLPKGSYLAARGQIELDQIAARLNGRPRKTLSLDEASGEDGRAARPGGGTQGRLEPADLIRNYERGVALTA